MRKYTKRLMYLDKLEKHHIFPLFLGDIKEEGNSRRYPKRLRKKRTDVRLTELGDTSDENVSSESSYSPGGM